MKHDAITRPHRARLFVMVIAGLAAGSAAGAGVGTGLYPPAIGVALAIVAGVVTGRGVWRTIRARRGNE